MRILERCDRWPKTHFGLHLSDQSLWPPWDHLVLKTDNLSPTSPSQNPSNVNQTRCRVSQSQNRPKTAQKVRTCHSAPFKAAKAFLNILTVDSFWLVKFSWSFQLCSKSLKQIRNATFEFLDLVRAISKITNFRLASSCNPVNWLERKSRPSTKDWWNMSKN